MIYIITGENSFEVTRELERLELDFVGVAEKIDGTELEVRQLPDLLMGATLFADKRLVIIKGMAENKEAWDKLPEFLERMSDDITLVLVEVKPDKRTRTYKALQKLAEVKVYTPWGDRDRSVAERWAVDEAKRQRVVLDSSLARLLIERTGVDQWRVFRAIEKLSVLSTVDAEVITRVIDLHPRENVFVLLETALKGDIKGLQQVTAALRVTEDPYMVFGLLSSQVFQLTALAVSDKPSAEVAKDIGAHPFVLSKLAPHARKQGKAGARRLLAVMYDTDKLLKTSANEPWLLIEHALLKIAAQ